MKIIKKSLIAMSVMLIPTFNAHAGLFNENNPRSILILDDSNQARIFERTHGNFDTGMRRFFDDDAYKTMQSRFSCPTPRNPHQNNILYPRIPSATYAKRWVASCFSANDIFNIQSDMARAMMEKRVKRGFYQLRYPVVVKKMSAPTNQEDRLITFEMILDHNTQPGQGIIVGVNISPSAYSSNYYVRYVNEAVDEFFGDMVDAGEDAGQLKVYEMDGQTPESSNLTLVDQISDDIFETTRLTEAHPLFDFDPKGVKATLEFAGQIMEMENSDVIVVDYVNPISINDCAIDPAGNCYPSNVSVDDPIYKSKFRIETPARSYERNVCTKEPITYKQDNIFIAETNQVVERYLVTDFSEVEPEISDEALIRLNRIVPFNSHEYANREIEVEYSATHTGYDYNLDIDYFEERIADFFSKRSTAPNNLFQKHPYCVHSNKDAFDYVGCQEPFNNIFLDYYEDPATVEDVSIIDVRYDRRITITPAVTEIDAITGEEIVITPAVYEYESESSCDAGGTRIYDVEDFCDRVDINCTSVITK
jgi:hypothetical protein